MTEDLHRAKWDNWTTVRVIGRGSFGTVYEIERDVFGEIEKAALKVISIPQNESEIDELYNEGYDNESITNTFHQYLRSIVSEYTLMRKLNGSANVVNCDDVRYIPHDNGMGWDVLIKMELLKPLPKALGQTIPEEQVLQVGLSICNALILCKKHSILHRDIKPANIFLSNNGDYKLGDFGVAKTMEWTSGATKIGTYDYMAPEVYHDEPYGSAADLYSLGMVLYWMLNERRTPFLQLPPSLPTTSEKEQARKLRFSGTALPAPKNGSDELKRIVLKACAFDPRDRYGSAEEMQLDLKKLSYRHFAVAIGENNTGESPDTGSGQYVMSKTVQQNDSSGDRLGEKGPCTPLREEATQEIGLPDTMTLQKLEEERFKPSDDYARLAKPPIYLDEAEDHTIGLFSSNRDVASEKTDINGYTMIKPFSTENAGLCRWGFCEKNGSELFIKEFLSPVYPVSQGSLSAKIVERKRRLCEHFYQEKKSFYQKLSSCHTGNNIVPRDFFRYGSKFYLVTAKVQSAGTDPRIIAKLDERRKTVFLEAILYSVACFHEAGIVHADLKPDNLLLKETEQGFFTAKIIDFDAGFLTDHVPSELSGDFVYLAPETYIKMKGMMEASDVDEKIDIFALGILFHQYWTGTLPQIEGKHRYVFEAVLNHSTVYMNPELPEGLGHLIQRMLLLDPCDRPGAGDLLKLLKRMQKEADGKKGR